MVDGIPAQGFSLALLNPWQVATFVFMDSVLMDNPEVRSWWACRTIKK